MHRHALTPGRRPSLGLVLLVLLARATVGIAGSEQHELLLFEETPITGAAKHAQSAREAPARVSVITREEIERYGYRTLGEALRTVPGFYLAGDRSYDQLGVRGFLRPNDFSDRILVLVNGHTYNNDLYQQAYLGQDFGIDLESIDHIEVIRGPGSALYGGNAFFAVVNVVTTTGRDTPGVQPLIETGSYARKRGQMSVGKVTESGIDFYASGSVLDVDGPETLFYPDYNSPRTNYGVAVDADAERALKFFASARYGGFFFQGGTNWREKYIPTGAYGTTFNDPGTKTTDAREYAELNYETRVPGDVDVNARIFYDGTRYHGTYIYGSGASRVKNQDLGLSHWLGGEVQGRRRVFSGNTLTLGVEYTYHPLAEQINLDLPSQTTYLDDTRSFDTVGVYGQDEWHLLPRVTLVTGLRYDRYYARLEQLSPRVALIWDARDETTLKLLYGQAFRPPNLFEQYYAYPSIGIQSLANPHLDPEQITTYEAVVEQGLWGRAQGTLSIYHYDIEDLIQRVERRSPTFNGVILQYVNGDSSDANGAEVELHVPLPHGIVARSAYSIQEARDADGHLLSNSPKHIGNVGVVVPLGWGLEAAPELIVVGPRHTLGGRRLEAVHLLNLNFTYQTPIEGLRATAGFYNLIDQTYPDPAGAQNRQDRIPQNGFTFRVQLRYAF
jgi:outer membrane receptor protein involved in Fe transport